MRNIYYIPIEENFIDTFVTEILSVKQDYSDTAVVFPNKRPFLFLQKKISRELQSSFIPPAEFTMDTFVSEFFKSDYSDWQNVNTIDLVWYLFSIIKEMKTPFSFESFETFFPWGEKIIRFLNQIDTENVSDEALRSVAENASIGYDSVPEQVNAVLMSLIDIRHKLHNLLEQKHLLYRGYIYKEALHKIENADFSKFRKIYFAGLFALTKAEQTIIKSLWQKGQADIIWNADPEEYKEILLPIKNYFKPDRVIKVSSGTKLSQQPKLFSAFDIHSEILQVYDVLKERDITDTVIVLPRSETLFPLLSLAVDGISSKIENFNISLQYPLMRTSLFALIQKIVQIQSDTRTEKGKRAYSSKEYIRIISNPFLKNIKSGHSIIPYFVRALTQCLKGNIKGSSLEKRIFITLDDILEDKELFALILKSAPFEISRKDTAEQISRFHKIVFEGFESVKRFKDLTGALNALLNYILQGSSIRSYILSGEILKHLYDLLSEMEQLAISEQEFSHQFFVYLFSRYLQNDTITFSTRPLQELEIIGMLETRNLNFKTVLILDVQDDFLPGKRSIDPLVPLEVYNQLRLPNYERKVEMNKYYFDRLVKSGKEVFLFYVENSDNVRSRFIEQIIWEEEKKQKQIGVLQPKSVSFPIRTADVSRFKQEIKKTAPIMERLNSFRFSSSSLDAYLACGLKFYYRYILRLHEDNMIAEGIDGGVRGSLVHSILAAVYKKAQKLHSVLTPDLTGQMQELLSETIDSLFSELPVTGESIMLKKITELKLQQFIKRDFQKEHFRVVEIEHPHSLNLRCADRQVLLTGVIDRINLTGNTYEIIDYKTGSSSKYKVPNIIEAVADVHKQDSDEVMEYMNLADSSIQLPLYVLLFSNEKAYEKVPLDNIEALYQFFEYRKSSVSLFDSYNRDEYMQVFRIFLDVLLKNIFDSELKFRKWEYTDCEYCAFKTLCGV